MIRLLLDYLCQEYLHRVTFYLAKKYVGQGCLNPNVEILLGSYTNAAPISYELNKSLVCSLGTVVGCSNLVSLRLLTALEAQL